MSSTMISQEVKETQIVKEKFSIYKNQWMFGGSFNFNTNNSEEEGTISESKGTSWNINPNVGYLINDNLILGLKAGYQFGSYSSINDSSDLIENNFDGYSIAPYLRKFFSISKKLAFYADGEIKFSNRWDDNRYTSASNIDNNESTRSVLFVGITPGITYSLSEKVYIYSHLRSLGYNKTTWERTDETSKADSFSFNLFTSNLSLGVLFVL